MAENQEEKSVLLDLVVKRSDGIDDVYHIDYLDIFRMVDIRDDPVEFIEISTKQTPGIRFVILRYPHVQQ